MVHNSIYGKRAAAIGEPVRIIQNRFCAIEVLPLQHAQTRITLSDRRGRSRNASLHTPAVLGFRGFRQRKTIRGRHKHCCYRTHTLRYDVVIFLISIWIVIPTKRLYKQYNAFHVNVISFNCRKIIILYRILDTIYHVRLRICYGIRKTHIKHFFFFFVNSEINNDNNTASSIWHIGILVVRTSVYNYLYIYYMILFIFI